MAMVTPLLFLSLTLLLFPTTHYADIGFQYYQFSDNSNNISMLGNARIYIHDLALEITNMSSGHATYDYPVRLLPISPYTSISFKTTFIFSIENDILLASPLSYGAGLTFHINFENKTVGYTSAFLGLSKASFVSISSPKYFAVEFDTHQDPQFQDLNDNHVGIDFNSLVSQQTKPIQTGSISVALALGNHIQAYLSYNSLKHVLDVSISPYMNNDYMKPAVSFMSVPVDLGSMFNEFMYVGFLAATGAGVVKYKIWSWTFKTTIVDGLGQPMGSSPDLSTGAPSPAGGY